MNMSCGNVGNDILATPKFGSISGLEVGERLSPAGGEVAAA